VERHTAGGHRQEAGDQKKDLVLRLYRRRYRTQPRARVSTWLCHISQNVARNALRSRRRRPCVRFEARPGTDGETLSEDRYLEGRSECPSRPLERAELAGGNGSREDVGLARPLGDAAVEGEPVGVEQRARGGKIPLVTEQQREVVDARCCRTMLRSQRLFVDGESTFEERPISPSRTRSMSAAIDFPS